MDRQAVGDCPFCVPLNGEHHRDCPEGSLRRELGKDPPLTRLDAPPYTLRGEMVLCRIVKRPGDRKTAGGVIVPDDAPSMEGVARVLVFAAGPDAVGIAPGDVFIVKQGTVYPVLTQDDTQYLLAEAVSFIARDGEWTTEDALRALAAQKLAPPAPKLVKAAS